MNDKYQTYLNSPEWKAKRNARSAISDHQCAVCGSKKTIHIHHLTYDRIFKEDMQDLVPLCCYHHQVAEDLLKLNKLPKMGHALHLLAQTIRVLSNWEKEVPIEDITPKHEETKKGSMFLSLGSIPSEKLSHLERELLTKLPLANMIQLNLVKSEDFMIQICRASRSEFKAFASQSKIKGSQCANAFALYDKFTRVFESRGAKRIPLS